jgi:hypothetical protein
MTLVMGLSWFPVAWADLNAGLVAHYPFDGNAQDVTGNGNDGTVNGATLTADRFGNADSAYNFDGVNDYIDMKDSPYIQSLVFGHGTVLTWFKTYSTKWGDIIGYFDAGQGEDGFVIRYQQNGEIYFILGDSSGNNGAYQLRVPNLGGNKWHHVAGVWDGNKICLYVDGNLVGSELYVAISEYYSKPVRLTVGAYPSDPSIVTFKGRIDDIRIYNRALSKSEIQQLYQGENNYTTNGGFTQADIDNAIEQGKQACISNPASCGINF